MAAPQPSPMGHSLSLSCLLCGGQAGLGQPQALLPWELQRSLCPSLSLGYLGSKHRVKGNTLLSPGSLYHLILSPRKDRCHPTQMWDGWAMHRSPLNWPGQVARTPPHSQLCSGLRFNTC